MAKNYTFAEAVKIINEGTDMEAIVDIGRRYPVLLHKVTKVCAKAGTELVELMGFMPEYLTANKVNTAIKAVLNGESTGGEDSGSDDEDDGDDVGEGAGGEAKDYESMSAKQLWDILGKAGKRKLAKSTKKADLVAACKAMDAGEEPEDDGDDDAKDEGKETGNPYEGKSAVDLFKECKKRGIKAEIKKPAKYYAELLVKDDAKSKDTGDDGDDDWDEDDDAKGTKKDAKTGKAGKAGKDTAKKDGGKDAKGAKADKDDDDGEDWDI